MRRLRFILIQFFLLSFAIVRSEEITVYDVASLDSPPTPVGRNSWPKFPTAIEGKRPPRSIEVDYIVGLDGQTHDVLTVGEANDEYDAAAIKAVKKWRFKPGTRHGLAVITRIRQELAVPDDDSLERRTGVSNIRPKKDDTATPLPFIISDHVVFPFGALQAGQNGHATVRYMIGYGGRARQLAVENTSSPEFAQAAIAALESLYFIRPETQAALLYESRTSIFYFKADGLGNVTIHESAKRILRALVEHPQSIVSAKVLDAPLKLIRSVSPTRPSEFHGGKPHISSLDLSENSILAAMSPRPPDGKAGEAIVEFYVDEDGFAQLPKVVSSTEPEFGAAAAQAISEWHFAPPTQGGNPVVVKVQVPVAFPMEQK